jgi:hypothetical protein
MTFEEARADWLATLAAHPGNGFIPAIGVWANMCGLERGVFEKRCRRSNPVEVARHALFRAIYSEERAAEYQRLRVQGMPRREAFNTAGISGPRAHELEPANKVFHDWQALLDGAREWLAQPRTTHELAERLGVDPQGLHNLRSRGLPRWLRVTKEGAYLRWQAKRLKSRG